MGFNTALIIRSSLIVIDTYEYKFFGFISRIQLTQRLRCSDTCRGKNIDGWDVWASDWIPLIHRVLIEQPEIHSDLTLQVEQRASFDPETHQINAYRIDPITPCKCTGQSTIASHDVVTVPDIFGWHYTRWKAPSFCIVYTQFNSTGISFVQTVLNKNSRKYSLTCLRVLKACPYNSVTKHLAE